MNYKISFIIPVMGRLHHVKQALESVLKQPESEVVLVDYSCPDHTADWAEKTFQEKYPNLHTIRHTNQEYFNLSKARNIGGFKARGEYLCFLDCDMILKEKFAEECFKLLDPDAEVFCAFQNEGNHGYAGMIIVPTENFKELGGYNENLKGWGYEDDDFSFRVAKNLLKTRIPNELASHIEHGDEDRSRCYEEKDIHKSWEQNKQLSIRQRNIIQPKDKEMLIPKILHFIWVGPKRYFKMDENIHSWKQNHPTWKFYFWTDQSDLSPQGCEIKDIKEIFPLSRQDLYNCLSVPVSKSDVLRLEIVRRFGGVYVDVDFENKKNIEEAIIGLEGFSCYSTEHINPGIFGAIPNSLWIDEILSALSREGFFSEIQLHGVKVMTRITQNHPNIHVFEDWVFYPIDFHGRNVY